MLYKEAFVVDARDLEEEFDPSLRPFVLNTFSYDWQGNDSYVLLDKYTIEEWCGEGYCYDNEVESKAILKRTLELIEEGKLPEEFYLLMWW